MAAMITLHEKCLKEYKTHSKHLSLIIQSAEPWHQALQGCLLCIEGSIITYLVLDDYWPTNWIFSFNDVKVIIIITQRNRNRQREGSREMYFISISME